jgi:hypothetical protein
MHTEIYIENARYDLAVKAITLSLNRVLADKLRRRHVEPFMNAVVTLRTNLPEAVGELRATTSSVGLDHYNDLARALADLSPDARTGRIETCAVKIALGEHGNIWPERVRPSPLEAAKEAVAEVRGLLRSIARNLALMHRDAILAPERRPLTLEQMGGITLVHRGR